MCDVGVGEAMLEDTSEARRMEFMEAVRSSNFEGEEGRISSYLFAWRRSRAAPGSWKAFVSEVRGIGGGGGTYCDAEVGQIG